MAPLRRTPRSGSLHSPRQPGFYWWIHRNPTCWRIWLGWRHDKRPAHTHWKETMGKRHLTRSTSKTSIMIEKFLRAANKNAKDVLTMKSIYLLHIMIIYGNCRVQFQVNNITLFLFSCLFKVVHFKCDLLNRSKDKWVTGDLPEQSNYWFWGIWLKSNQLKLMSWKNTVA